MRKTIPFLFLLLLSLSAMAQKKHCISGYVMDAASRETLIGATVLDHNTGQGCATNNYGYYSLTLDEGPVDLQFSFVGYDAVNQTFNLVADTLITVKMSSNIQLQEVTVEANRATVGANNPQMSVIELPIKQIKSIPTLMGEADVLKAIQLLPGVQNGSEGSAGLYVRGGGPDENLLLMDGVPLYNVNHMFGFFSVFNPDALKNVTLYKGGFPARYGGRISSVVDVRMKDGDMQKYHGNFSIGLISSKLNLEGPIVKDKLSFNLSFRRTYSDALTNLYGLIGKWADPSIDKFSLGYYFYDLNAKLNWKISDKDRLYLSWYSGDDKIYANVKWDYAYEDMYADHEKLGLNWKWGNKVGALRWNHIISPKLFMDASASYTQYRHDLGMDQNYTYEEFKPNTYTSTDEMAMNFHSGIHDLTARTDFHYAPNPRHDIRFGGGYTYHFFRPEVQSMKINFTEAESNMDTVANTGDVHAHEAMLYVEDNIALSEAIKMNVGLHYSAFAVQGNFYHSLQPRFSMSAMVAPHFSLKAGYAYMTQYIHLLSNSNITMPTDLWVPVTARIAPEKGHQFSLGGFYELPNLFDVSLEGYYKTMDNVLEYKDGTSFFGTSQGWEDKVNLGRGWAYGIELLVQRSFGKTTGWIGYTWSRSMRKFDREGMEINNGNPFPAKYDRRHDFSITVQHKFSDRFDISGTWVISSGNCGTLSTQTYPGIPITYYSQYGGSVVGTPNIGYVERNNFRMPVYHRLDLGMNFRKQKKHGERVWNISVSNVYNRQNPFIVIRGYDQHTGLPQLQQVSIFPIIPSVSYSYKF